MPRFEFRLKAEHAWQFMSPIKTGLERVVWLHRACAFAQHEAARDHCVAREGVVSNVAVSVAATRRGR